RFLSIHQPYSLFSQYVHHRPRHPFPTRRSSDLVQDDFILCPTCRTRLKRVCPSCGKLIRPEWNICPFCAKDFDERDWTVHPGGKDRKSTRLNSSHRTISYAVFCLKKKKITLRYF